MHTMNQGQLVVAKSHLRRISAAFESKHGQKVKPALAEEFDCSWPAVNKWFKSGVIPCERMPQFVKFFNMQGILVLAYQLRPDAYAPECLCLNSTQRGD